MKNQIRIVFLFVVGLTMAVSSFAQDNVIRINPFKPFTLRTVEVAYDRVLSDHITLGLNVQGILTYNLLNQSELLGLDTISADYTLNSATIGGFKVTPEFRYFFSGNAPEGFYAGVFARISQTQLKTSSEFSTTSGSTTSGVADVNFRLLGGGLGIDLGYQWVIGKGFVIDYHAGLGFVVQGVTLGGSLTDINSDDIQSFVDETNQTFEDNSINIVLDADDFEQNFSVALGGVTLPVFRSVLTIGYAF